MAQGEDREILAQIRSKIVASDTLSVYGKNVKIVVRDGEVTLRGPVRSAEEKSWIARTSEQAAPSYRVINELEVSTS